MWANIVIGFYFAFMIIKFWYFVNFKNHMLSKVTRPIYQNLYVLLAITKSVGSGGDLL